MSAKKMGLLVLGLLMSEFVLAAPKPQCRPCSPPVVAAAGTAQCNDRNPCTYDWCNYQCNANGVCTGCCRHDPLSGPVCDINDCYQNEHCVNGVCEGVLDCNDNDSCTTDVCSFAFDEGCLPNHNDCYYCAHDLDPSVCDDGNACTDDFCTGDHCTYDFNQDECSSDGNVCTRDECFQGACYPPANEFCTDGNACTNDRCINGSCVSTPVSCSDNDGCTEDHCNSQSGCYHTPVICPDDGDPCTPEYCAQGLCRSGHSDCEGQEEPCSSDPVVNDYPVCKKCTVSISTPASLRLNCDDDNDDGIIDLLQNGPVQFEDDLEPVFLSWNTGCGELGNPGDEVVWRIAEGRGNRTYRAFRYSNKTGPIDAFGSYQPWPPPSMIWIEGISATEAECPTRLVVWVGVTYAGGGYCIYCGYEDEAFEVVGPALDVTIGGVIEEAELVPGGLLCVNDDDDNANGVPDKDDAGAIAGEDDLQPMNIYLTPGMTGAVTVEGNAAAQAKLKVYSAADRSGLITNWQWTASQLPITVYVEAIAKSDAPRDLELRGVYSGPEGLCDEKVNLTAIHVEMDPVTGGTNPVPMNPAIVAPMTPLSLADFSLWWEANTFGATKLQPDIDLSPFPITWSFNVTSGSLTPSAQVVVAADKRSARVEIPFPSSGNLGAGRMKLRLGDGTCASVTTVIKNVQPDLEPGDFRFQVKAHLCTDGAGTSTSRTAAEVRAIMSDVTKVLSQCGIIVTLGEVVVETVPTALVDDVDTYLGSVDHELLDLFDYSEDEANIDLYFVQQIQGGADMGITVTPTRSFSWEAGIAIADHSSEGNLEGQELARVAAHEIGHYLLNHLMANDDHRSSENNLMYTYASENSRDLDQVQCQEIRSNFGVD